MREISRGAAHLLAPTLLNAAADILTLACDRDLLPWTLLSPRILGRVYEHTPVMMNHERESPERWEVHAAAIEVSEHIGL